jgi:hypothetical protein
MKYKNEEIGIPTLEMVEECCKDNGMDVPASEVYNYWKKKNFLTKQKLQVKTVEAMCSCVNSIYLQNLRKNSQPGDPFYKDVYNEAKNLAKAEKWIHKNFDRFCDNMKLIMDNKPQMYAELCNKFQDNLITRPV